MPPSIPPPGNPKEWLKQLTELIKEFKLSIDTSKPFDPADVSKKWASAWKVLRVALLYVRDSKITGEKLDDKINKAIALGDTVKDPKSIINFLAEVKKYWKWVKIALTLAKSVLPAKYDKLVDDVIRFVDWLTKASK